MVGINEGPDFSKGGLTKIKIAGAEEALLEGSTSVKKKRNSEL
jgi:hypothetical protein